MAIEETHHVRCLRSGGEVYVCLADLTEILGQMARKMPNEDDRQLATKLVTWLRTCSPVGDPS